MPTVSDKKQQRYLHYWNKHASTYDREIQFFERHLFGTDARAWACSRATGKVLEVAIGTGLNLPHYPENVSVTGIEWSSAMLDVARTRARDLGRDVDLQQADAQTLPFDDETFDTAVCFLGLCAIPDEAQAIVQMKRVLRPGGRLILVDHVPSTNGPVRGIQRLLELITAPLQGEHFLRRPLRHVEAAGFVIEEHQQYKLGIVERLTARKP
jgi:ubiquinone/menaquinone biosynthesis C-methylase UbiE